MRISYIDAGIQTIPLSTIVEINRKKATIVNFHSNRINTLEIRIPTLQKYHCNKNNKDEDYIRSGGCINHLLELDFSSNLLGDGYNNNTTMPILGTSRKISLLGLCNNLRKLNLSTNNLNEKSFNNLAGDTILPNLQTIDISQNRFNKLPTKLHVLCPSLKHLYVKKNQIQSLTTLLQTLHNHRGRLETVVLTNNPVCSKELYFEKILFVLGTSLSSLDCRKVTSNDRESARIRLERGLSIKNTVTSPKQECIPPSISRRNRVLVQEADDNPIEHKQREWYQEKEDEQHPQRNNTAAVANVELRTLKEKVASLSARIEEQALSTNRSTTQHFDKENVPPEVSPKKKSSRMKMTRSNDKELYTCQQKAATHLMNTIILRQKHDQTIVQLAFSLWRLSTKLKREKESKTKCIEAEKNWQVKAQELDRTNKSLSEESEKLKQSAQLSDKVTKVCDKKILELKQQVNDLEESLKFAKTNQEQSIGMLDISKADVQRLEATLLREREEAKAEARRVEHNFDTLREELKHTAKQLDAERRERTVVESVNKQISIANEESTEVAKTSAQQLHKLKLVLIEKEATIQRLKDSYKQAARKAALDNARCDQLSSSEQQAREQLDQQTNKMQNLEAENERLVNDYKAQQTSKLNEITSKEAKINILTSLVEEKEMAINASERQIKSIMHERNSIQRQLTECNSQRSRSEQRVNQLQSQLDQAVDDIRNVKRSSVDKEERLEAEASRASELKNSLVSLEANNRDMNRDNMLLRNEVAKLQQMSTSLKKKVQQGKSQWKSREKEIASSHYEEIQKLRDKHEQTLLSVNRKFEDERSMRLEAEQKAAVLKAEVDKQKLKMQSAIEGLARQLTE